MVEELRIPIVGGEVAGLAWGPVDGPPVLCLHGWLDNAASFTRLLPLLGGPRFVAIDLPGHGFSFHKFADGHYGFIDAVVDVARVLDALAWPAATLLGHSLGAGLASVLAGAQPQRVQRLVLLDALGPLSEPAEQAASRLGRAIDEQRRKLGRGSPVYASHEEVIARITKSFARLSAPAAAILCERGLRAVPGGVTWRTDSRLRWASRTRLVEEQVLSLLRGIACPTLFVQAAAGMPVDADQLGARLAAVADLRHARVAGGHHVHLEDPAPVARIIAGFLGIDATVPEAGP